MLLACLSRSLRARMTDLLALAPLPALAAALLAYDGPPLVLDQARLQITLALDPPAAMLLGVAALLWSAAGLYARSYMGQANRSRFAVWWLLSLTGSVGVFMAADMASFYVFFGMASLAAWGLVIHDGTPDTLRAGAIYLGLAVLAEICLLMAFALLAAATPGSSLLIGDAVALLPTSPGRNATLAFLIVGFGLKVGLVPLHVWLPLAYRGSADPGGGRDQRRDQQGGRDRTAPLPAPRRRAAGLGRSPGHCGASLGLLRRRGRDHADQPEDRAGVLEREPDGFRRHGAGHGAGRGRWRRRHGRGLLCGAPRPGQGCAVPRRGRGRRDRRAPPLAGAAAGGGAGARLRRPAAHRRLFWRNSR